MIGLAGARSPNQGERVEVVAAQTYPFLASGFGEVETVLPWHMAADPPLADRDDGNAKLHRELFDHCLHGRNFDTVSTKCQALVVDARSISDSFRARDTGHAMSNAPTDLLAGFAVRVKAARVAAGYKSQRALADALGISHHSVSVWEKGRNFAHAPDLYALSKVLHVTIDWLVSGDDRGMPIETLRRIAKLKA